MDKVLLPPGDEYDKKCGEIFLTINGNVVFHCTLCEDKFSGFHNYFDHVYKRHYTPISEKRKTADHLHALMGFNVKKEPTKQIVEIPEDVVQVEILNDKSTENSTEFVDEQQFDDTNEAENSSDDENSIEDEDDAEFIKKPTKRPKRKSQEEKNEILQCPHCEYITKHKRHMRDHVKRHVDKKDHKCTYCPMAFFNKYELISHTRTHTGERPYLCPDCGRGFAKSSGLLEHVKRHKNIRDKECDICKMRFYNAKELRIHKAVHSDARPFACNLCEKAFKTRLSLKTHSKIHANKREYVCNFCNATFNQSSGLYAHINNKH